MSTSPPVERTDPGMRLPTTPEASEQKNDKIGEHAEITLPDVVPIADKAHAGKVLLWFNEQWIQLHNVTRGFAGTGVEWYLFFVGVSMRNPRISAGLLALLIVFTEENFSTQPVLTNIMKYGMHYFDPEAADKIFAEREVDPDPIGRGIKLTIEKATKDYMDSSEYRDLQEEVTLYTQYQFQRGTYISSGMTDELEDLDAKMGALRAERAEKKAKETEVSPTAVTYSPLTAAPPPEHRQGRGIEAEPADEPSEEPVPEEVAPAEDVAPEGEQMEGKVRRGKDDGKASKVERVIDGIEALGLPPPKR